MKKRITTRGWRHFSQMDDQGNPEWWTNKKLRALPYIEVPGGCWHCGTGDRTGERAPSITSEPLAKFIGPQKAATVEAAQRALTRAGSPRHKETCAYVSWAALPA